MKLSFPQVIGVGIFIIFLALVLRVVPIFNESLEGDEMFSLRVAESSTTQALNLIRKDLVHPPFYYFLLKMTMPDHPASPLDVRLLSLAACAASITILILIGGVVSPLRGPAILAAFWLALNKTHIFYSQQARSYALFCVLVGMLLLWSFVIDRYEREWMFWLAGFGLMTVLLYTHYFAVFYCAGIVLPVMLTSRMKRLRIKAIACLAIAFLAFLPWIWQLIPFYQEKSGLSSNLGWLGPPTLYDLKMAYADYLGIPFFQGATSLVFLVGLALIVVAWIPDLHKTGELLDSRTKITLTWTTVMPPLIVFLLSRWPFNVPIFEERHFLPSILGALLVVAYALCRLSELVPKRLQIPVLLIGTITLTLFQATPVWSQWPLPSRIPYAAIAEWLSHNELDLPVYTTCPYCVGEPVAFYLKNSRTIDQLPANPATVPDKCIVLYRPAAKREDVVVASMLERFKIIEQKYYTSHNSQWGTRMVLLQRR